MTPPEVGDHFQASGGGGCVLQWESVQEWGLCCCSAFISSACACLLQVLICLVCIAAHRAAPTLAVCSHTLSTYPPHLQTTHQAQATIKVPKDAYSMDFVFT